MSESQNILKKEFLDPEYRYAYAEDFLNTVIAAQIKTLREGNWLTLAGTKQAGISRLESVHYSNWKTQTLKRLARALGVRLKVTFEDFSTLLGEAEAFSRRSLERKAFDEDATFYPTQIPKRSHRHRLGRRLTFADIQQTAVSPPLQGMQSIVPLSYSPRSGLRFVSNQLQLAFAGSSKGTLTTVPHISEKLGEMKNVSRQAVA